MIARKKCNYKRVERKAVRFNIYIFKRISRFCPEKYHPFNPDNIDKYVIGDDYLPTWEVPSLKKYYVDQGASMKASVEAHLKAQGDHHRSAELIYG